MSDDARTAPAPPDRDAIDAALARRLIDAQFPRWSDLPIAPVAHDGWDNRTFRLGAELSIRLPTGSWYAKQVDKEQRWLPFLAPRLPLPIPVPVARGTPGDGFPYSWSVYRWLDGEIATTARVVDAVRFAADLAAFLVALRRVDAADGPPPGEHNFFRGGPLAVYEEEALAAVDTLGGEIHRDAVLRAWEDAMRTTWDRAPVWVHGDVASGNLLVRDGRLAAVLDFGSSGVGDPACDVVVTWTSLPAAARDRFRATLGLDPATWARGRGWALWKALVTLVGHPAAGRPEPAPMRAEIERVLQDAARER